ncbi:uncharacterized protein LOC141586061 [Silene latifolia]|uniref:uncharacterized protein LOC141586061 n=1 Tax=Silene latifolia TaxID=37657 RepID=UPI003D76D20A
MCLILKDSRTEFVLLKRADCICVVGCVSSLYNLKSKEKNTEIKKKNTKTLERRFSIVLLREKMEVPKKEGDVIADKESTLEFFQVLGISTSLPDFVNSDDFYSRLFGRVLTVDSISRGHVTCSFTVLPCLVNIYNGLNGGAVAAVVERLAIACARTVVPEDKSLFLGEMSVSYLSAATINSVLIADASLVRSGRNLSVVSVELKLKETAKLVYTAHATFFHLPASKL